MDPNTDNVNQAEAVLAGGVAMIDEIIDAVNEVSNCSNTIKALNSEIKNREQEVKMLVAKMENDTAQAIREGLVEATAKEDQILKEHNAKLKEARQKREKAKNKGMKARIDEETKELVEQNKIWKRQIRRDLKENGLPGMCDSKIFFVMFSPNCPAEWIIRVAVFCMFLLVIPTLILTISDPFWLFKIFWFVVMDVIFLGVYVTIFLMSKDKDTGTLERVRELREEIADATKKINEIRNNIRSDSDESRYNLGEFDEEIKEEEVIIAEARIKREGKEKEFHEFTKAEIIERIQNEMQPIIDERSGELESKRHEAREWNDKYSAITKKINEEYLAALGKGNLEISKLQQIRQKLEQGECSTIGQALSSCAK